MADLVFKDIEDHVKIYIQYIRPWATSTLRAPSPPPQLIFTNFLYTYGFRKHKSSIDMANNYVLLGRFHWPC